MSRIILGALFLIAMTGPLCARATHAGENYAFLVAVRDYPKAKLGDLRYVENDLEELSGALQKAGYKLDNIVHLSQTRAGQQGARGGARFAPTGENIRRELKVLLGSLGKDDSVVVAFAGHGVQFQGAKESYLCPSDADLEQLDSLLAVTEIYSQLKASEARVKVLLVDACRSDPAIATSRGPRGVELEAVGKPQEIEAPRGIVALFSCSSGQKAWEHSELRHGVFFNFVIAGLKGEADKDLDDRVTYNELSDYTIAEVKRYARVKLGELQVPLQRGEFEGQIALARLERPAPAIAVAPFGADEAKQRQQEWAAYRRVQPVHTNSLKMKFSLIPPGEFAMGSPATDELRHSDEQQHKVRITKPYYLAQTEVTIGQFREFVKAANYRTYAEQNGGFGWFGAKKQFGQSSSFNWGAMGWDTTDDHPATNVTLSDAQEFCTWLGRKEGRTYRLPTEAEWEYACRAGTTTTYFSGNDPEGVAEFGNIADVGYKDNVGFVEGGITARDGYIFTAPVAQLRANAFGLFDMHGNVWEHCSDWYSAVYYDSLADRTVNDPAGPGDGGTDVLRVIRSGAFNSAARGARAADRWGVSSVFHGATVGFRVVLDPTPNTNAGWGKSGK